VKLNILQERQETWLAQLLAELKSEQQRRFTLKMDSQSAIALSKNPVHLKEVSTSTRWSMFALRSNSLTS
jgi:hypothetical protein